MATKLSESTELQVPVKNLIGMVAAAATATWLYFGVIERLNNIEHSIAMIKSEQKLNSEFRIRWPRGELGSLPADSRQDMLLEHLQNELDHFRSQIEKGEAPFDVQQKLNIEFIERRLTNLENSAKPKK